MDVEGRLTPNKPKLDPTCELFLTGDPELRSMSHLLNWWPVISCFGLGLGAAFFHNMVQRKPRFSGVQRHIGYSLLGLVIGLKGKQIRREMQGERDLMLYHYMSLHPEDFPPPERVRYRDYLRPWIPIR